MEVVADAGALLRASREAHVGPADLREALAVDGHLVVPHAARERDVLRDERREAGGAVERPVRLLEAIGGDALGVRGRQRGLTAFSPSASSASASAAASLRR